MYTVVVVTVWAVTPTNKRKADISLKVSDNQKKLRFQILKSCVFPRRRDAPVTVPLETFLP